MKLIYMGTPALAVPPLEVLAREHEIALVVTQSDKPVGRSKTPQPSPVKQWAIENGVAVSQPQRARDESFVEELKAVAPDGIAVVAFGQILPRAVLELAPRGCANLHYSLLPRWRGAAPVQHALLNGDKTTGVTTQWMAEKLDAGDLILTREVEILPEETTADLWQKLTPVGCEVLRDTMRLLENGAAPRVPQDENLVTMAPQLKREDGKIRWDEAAQKTVNRVRAMNPWPGAWCEFRGANLKIWRAQLGKNAPQLAPGKFEVEGGKVFVGTNDGAIELIEVQAEGRPRLAAAEWARGARL